MGWFNWFGRKSHETVYAERIYEAFVDDEMGDMTPDKLRVPKEALRRYQEKALFHREAFAFAALAKAATNDPLLLRVLMELERLIVTKRSGRGAPVEKTMDAAFHDVERLFVDPFKWAQDWLSEFRSDPDDNFMVFHFANHWQAQFKGMKGGIEKTRRRQS